MKSRQPLLSPRRLLLSCLALATPLMTGHAWAQLTSDDLDADLSPVNGAPTALGLDNCSAYLLQETTSDLLDQPYFEFTGRLDLNALNGESSDDEAEDADAGTVDAAVDAEPADYTFHTMLWRSSTFTSAPGGNCDDDVQTSCAKGITGSDSCRCLSVTAPTVEDRRFTSTLKISELHTDPCAEGNREVLHFFFRYAKEVRDDQGQLTEIEIVDSAPASLVIDLQRPRAPEAPPLGAIPNDGSLTISLTNPRATYADISDPAEQAEALNDLNDFEICYRLRLPGEEAPTPVSPEGATNDLLRDGFTCQAIPLTTRYELTGLANNTEYWITYAARDAAGNRSANSPAILASPVGGAAFTDIYNFQGGGEQGGCQSARGVQAGGVALALLALLGLRRRRRG